MVARISIMASAHTLLISAFGIAPVHADEMRTLAPASPWEANWGAESCSLQRTFTSADKSSTLLIERFGAADDFALTIFDQQLTRSARDSSASLRFGSLPIISNVAAVPMQTQGGLLALVINATSLRGQYVRRGNDLVWPTVRVEDEAAATSIGVRYAGRNLVLQTGPLTKPFAALRACTDDLVKSWGLDPAQQAALSRRVGPSNRPGPWVTDADYPPAMLRAREEATVRFRLMVDARGKPTSCHVQRNLGNRSFNEPTCALLMRRAAFKPALDATGQPVPSYYVHQVAWIIPG